MLKFSRIYVILSVCLLVCGLVPASAQNTVLNTSSALPGGGTGTNNVVIGPGNIYPSANSADRNVFIGGLAGFSNTTGDENLFMGYQSGYNNTSGSLNSFIGYQAGYANTAASTNLFMGFHAGYNNTSGSPNSFVGFRAGFSNTTGGYNSFMGFEAGNYNTIGGWNSFMGYQAGYSNTDGFNNAFIGYKAGYNNTSGGENAFLGGFAGTNNTIGKGNTFIGLNSGPGNVTGHDNTSIGRDTGRRNVIGYRNSYFGVFADATGPNKSGLYSATAIGANALVGVDYGLVLGDTTNVKVGIGTAYPNQRLTIRGNLNYVAYDNSMMLKNQPFLHFNEHESLALGLGAEIVPGAEKTLVLGSKGATVQIPGILNGSQPQAGQFLTLDDQGNLLLSHPRVQVASIADWSDKVFEPGYALRPLGEVEDFVKKNKHLPGVPSAEAMVNEGMESTAFNAKLLEKIEELTLYLIELKKENNSQRNKNKELETRLSQLEKPYIQQEISPK